MAIESEAFDQKLATLAPKIVALLPRYLKHDFERRLKSYDYFEAMEVVDGEVSRWAYRFAESCTALDAIARTHHSFGKGARKHLRQYKAVSHAAEELRKLIGDNYIVVHQRRVAQISRAY